MGYSVDAIGAKKDLQGGATHVGKFEKLEDAVSAAEQMVNSFLEAEHKKGMTPKMLLACYEERGLHPFIFLDHNETTFNVRSFNHFQYALKRCAELCKGDGSA